ncbi:MAG: GntR family transcriptional regulator [Firmicutes bacterium]|nr:GntR family transcriptional regulator [Bacillota bacterium]
MMKTRTSFVPAYYRVAEDLKTKIDRGELKPGDMIPSTAQLARQYGVSHMTVRHGLELLAKDGYIESVQGKGSFVASPRMDTLVLDFSEEKIFEKNRGFGVQLHEVEIIPADEKISHKLGVKKGNKVLKIRRILSDERGPVAVDSRFLPYVRGAPLLEKEIAYAAFPDLVARHTELVSVKNVLEVSPCILTKEEAELLDARAGLPALCIEQIIYAAKNRPIGWSKMICRGDRFTLKAVSRP